MAGAASSGGIIDSSYAAALAKKKLPIQTPANPALTSSYNLYGDAVNSDNSMRDSLLSGYKGLFDNFNSSAPTNVSFDPYTYKPFQYQQSADYTNALGKLNGLAENGGYSADDVSNLRERAVSPIRSIYANANREVDRSRSLQGGYSPSFNALKAKMARESADQIGKSLNDANAGIAEKVAAGKQAAIGELGSLTGSENATKNQLMAKDSENANDFGAKNTDLKNQAKTLSFQLPMQKTDMLSKLLDGMRSIYGTTPAASSLFGSQALQTAGLQNNINQSNTNNGMDMIKLLLSGGGRK